MPGKLQSADCSCSFLGIIHNSETIPYSVSLTLLYRDVPLIVASLRERLRTHEAHKVFTKDQCFYLDYNKFSIKSYVLDVY